MASGYFRALWTLVLILTVAEVDSECDIPAAQTCLNSQLTPTNAGQCTTALSTLTATVICVDTNTDTCSTDESDGVRTTLQNIQTAVSDECADETCADFGVKYPAYERCLIDHDLPTIISNLKTAWNDDTGSTVFTGESVCISMSRVNSCLRESSRSCERLRNDLGQLYTDNPELKQLQDICGLETSPTSTRGPRIADCDRDIRTVVTQLQSNCPFTGNNPNPIEACIQMQAQIDCVVQQQRTCPLAVTQFLKPRIDTYSAFSHFCNNVTLNAVRVRPIMFNDLVCSYDNVMGCFSMITSMFGSSPGLSADNLLRIAQWNTFNNISFCAAMVGYNSTASQFCTLPPLDTCTVPFPTFGALHIQDREDFDLDLYNIIVPGPVGINQYGAKFIADRRNFICFEGCNNRVQLLADLTNNCQPVLETEAAAVLRASDKSVPCSDFESVVLCAANASISCPLLLSDVEAVYADNDVMTALAQCNLETPELLPPGYHPTPRPTLGSTTTGPTFPTTPFPTTTRGPIVTTSRETHRTTQRPPASTAGGSSSTASTPNVTEDQSPSSVGSPAVSLSALFLTVSVTCMAHLSRSFLNIR